MLKINLKRLLFERDLNQSQLSQMTKIRYNTINMYYHGFIKRMNVDDINKICKALNCKIEDLLEYVPDE